MRYILLLFLALPGVAFGETAFYVAPGGNDSGPGTRAEPFATLAHAQTAARGAAGAVVKIGAGTYRLDAPLRFGPEDSNVTYQAEGGKAVVSGGRTVSGWKQGEGGRWTVELSEVREGTWHFRQLFMDGRRLVRGRFPNGDGLLKIEAVSDDLRDITLAEKVGAGDLGGKDAELVVYHEWALGRALVESSEGGKIRTTVPLGWVGHALVARAGKVAYVENAPELVDEAGEWYLDRKTGVLTVMLEAGEDANKHEFIAPRIEQLVIVEGRPDAKVKGLRFEGIAFEHTEWPLPSFGYMGIQAGHYGTTMLAKTYVLSGAIEFTYAEGCEVQACRVEHTGACGVVIGAGCVGNRVTGCTLVDIGGNGVMTGWRGKGQLVNGPGDTGEGYLAGDWAEKTDVPSGNVVEGNDVSLCAAVDLGCVGIFDAFCSGTRIAKNHVYDLPYTGISIGYRWTEEPTSQRDCVVEGNHIHDCMKVLSDGGGIYTLGFQPGTVLRGNEIHDIHRSWHALQAPNNGIFFDQGSSGIHVAKNKIYRTAESAIRFNQTTREKMTWEGNDFEGAN